MEMHQVRYFLAVARTLNFTRAADECNVTQPSLTRAIKQLEAELGGDLFRRERPAGLTELGQRMHPLLKQLLPRLTRVGTDWIPGRFLPRTFSSSPVHSIDSRDVAVSRSTT
jgi:DNA-binding transcriptional LysR family regulator